MAEGRLPEDRARPDLHVVVGGRDDCGRTWNLSQARKARIERYTTGLGGGMGGDTYPALAAFDFTGRFTITQADAAKLWPVLKRFAETGEL